MKKLTRIDKIIIVSAVFLSIFILGFWLSLKRPNRNYYLPPAYEGWVSIKYNYPDATMSHKGEKGLELYIPDSGYLTTSSPLEKGWGKDRFYWRKQGSDIPIPNYIEKEGQVLMYIHARDIRRFSHESILKDLPIGTDTILWDGTHIKRKSNNEVSYQPGEPTLEYFYIFKEPQPIDIQLPPNPRREALESLKDYELNTSN